LVRQPAKGGEGHHSVRADDNQPFEAVSDTWKSSLMTFGTDPILEEQVTTVDPDVDAVAEQHHNAVSRHD
jgi:hypothetical protein